MITVLFSTDSYYRANQSGNKYSNPVSEYLHPGVLLLLNANAGEKGIVENVFCRAGSLKTSHQKHARWSLVIAHLYVLISIFLFPIQIRLLQ